jgi:hypothetical protein
MAQKPRLSIVHCLYRQHVLMPKSKSLSQNVIANCELRIANCELRIGLTPPRLKGFLVGAKVAASLAFTSGMLV